MNHQSTTVFQSSEASVLTQSSNIVRTSAGGKRTPTETITQEAPKRPPRIPPQTPNKGDLGDPEGAIADDPIEVHVQEIPRPFRARYRTVVSGRSRKETIKYYCLECVGWILKEVEECSIPDCQFFKWRMNN